MRIIFSLLGGLLLQATTAFATGTPALPGYALDPSLSAKCHSSPTAAKESQFPLRFQADDKSAALHLLTEIPFSPYLSASREAGPEEEGTPSGDFNPESQYSPSLDDYHLEAGFACPLNDSTRLKVGYRFAEPMPNMMDQVPTTLQEQADDLRISLDFKLPF
ncbi:hypothetical protein [Desulfuromonas sp. TF]|jgi:hypothetical protein|uniref:hypothetical protein n=1 Tax=Desulfuromonas sp. TF TaxID=1232410 RepID=UPI0004262F58|nr:hypothetical protein [Desulfuromonas sp. TF]